MLCIVANKLCVLVKKLQEALAPNPMRDVGTAQGAKEKKHIPKVYKR